MGKAQNRRADSERAEVVGDLVLAIRDERTTIRGDAMDISIHGINFLCDEELPLFREVQVRMKLPGQKGPIRCHGVVVRNVRRVNSLKEIALYFMDLKPADKSRITRYVYSVRKIKRAATCQRYRNI